MISQFWLFWVSGLHKLPSSVSRFISPQIVYPDVPKPPDFV